MSHTLPMRPATGKASVPTALFDPRAAFCCRKSSLSSMRPAKRLALRRRARAGLAGDRHRPACGGRIDDIMVPAYFEDPPAREARHVGVLLYQDVAVVAVLDQRRGRNLDELRLDADVDRRRNELSHLQSVRRVVTDPNSNAMCSVGSIV